MKQLRGSDADPLAVRIPTLMKARIKQLCYSNDASQAWVINHLLEAGLKALTTKEDESKNGKA